MRLTPVIANGFLSIWFGRAEGQTSAKVLGTVSPRMSEKKTACCSPPDVECLLKASLSRLNSVPLTTIATNKFHWPKCLTKLDGWTKKQSGKRISSSFPTSSYCGLYWLNTMAIVDESVTNGRTQFAIIPDSFSYVAQVKMVIADGT